MTLNTTPTPKSASDLIVDLEGRVGSALEMLTLIENAPGAIRTAQAKGTGLQFRAIVRGNTLRYLSVWATGRLVLDSSRQAPPLRANVWLTGREAWSLLLQLARERRLSGLTLHLRGFSRNKPFNENCELSLTQATLDLARHQDEGPMHGEEAI